MAMMPQDPYPGVLPRMLQHSVALQKGVATPPSAPPRAAQKLLKAAAACELPSRISPFH
jgi:hypothetical protein